MSESVVYSDPKQFAWFDKIGKLAENMGVPESVTLNRVGDMEVDLFQRWVAPVLDLFDGDIEMWDCATTLDRLLLIVGYHGKDE